jgi:hypothetical protein
VQSDYDRSRFNEISPRKPLAQSECHAIILVGEGPSTTVVRRQTNSPPPPMGPSETRSTT